MTTKKTPIQESGRGDTIRLKNSYFEGLMIAGPNRQPMFSKPFQSLLEKNIFPGEFKPRYWLGRVFDKIIQEMNQYLEIKQKLIRDHTRKYESDGKKLNGKAEVMKEWKKGDPIFLDTGAPDWIDAEKFAAEFAELQEIEVDLGIRPIAFDPEKGPDAVGQEMLLLIPLLQEPREESGKPARRDSGGVVPFKKEI